MRAEDLDEKFDRGEEILGLFEVSKARRVEQEQKRVNVDFPLWMILSLDKEARRLGIPRQSLIKMLIARHFEEARS